MLNSLRLWIHFFVFLQMRFNALFLVKLRFVKKANRKKEKNAQGSTYELPRCGPLRVPEYLVNP